MEREVSQGVKRSLSCDEADENDEKKIKMPEDLSGVSEMEKPKTTLSEQALLLDLNDDCFYVILSHMGIYDLTNVANVCVRLRNCATYVFQHYHKSSICFDWRSSGGRSVDHNEVREAVRIFGPHIKEMTLNMTIFNKLFSSDSALSMVHNYCKSLDTVILNELKFTRWIPAKYVDYMKIVDPTSDDSDDWNDDDDDDRIWHVGDVSPKFLTNLPKVKNVIVHKGTLSCGPRLFDDWRSQIDTMTLQDVLVGDGFLKAIRNSYNEVTMTVHNEARRGRDSMHTNYRIVKALFTPK